MQHVSHVYNALATDILRFIAFYIEKYYYLCVNVVMCTHLDDTHFNHLTAAVLYTFFYPIFRRSLCVYIKYTFYVCVCEYMCIICLPLVSTHQMKTKNNCCCCCLYCRLLSLSLSLRVLVVFVFLFFGLLFVCSVLCI